MKPHEMYCRPPVHSVRGRYLQLFKTPEERAIRLFVTEKEISYCSLLDTDELKKNDDYETSLDCIYGYAEKLCTYATLDRILFDFDITGYNFSLYQTLIYESKGICSPSGTLNFKFYALLFLTKRGEEVYPEDLPFEYERVDETSLSDAIEDSKYDRESYAQHCFWLKRQKRMIVG